MAINTQHMEYTSVMLFEDNADLRASLRLLIEETPGFVLIGEYPDCTQVAQKVLELQPDVVLMDIDMPVVNGIAGLSIIKDVLPETLVIMLTVFDKNEHIFEALQAGADGYLLKKSSPDEIISAIKEVLDGGAPMTPAIARKVLTFFTKEKKAPKDDDLGTKERQVLGLLVEGFSYKMIAVEQDISIETVRSHIKNIYRKLQVHSMSEAVVKAIREKLVDPKQKTEM